MQDKFGRTPIVDALFKGQRETIVFLKQQKALTQPEKFVERWLNCIAIDDFHMIKCFIDFGIDPNCADYDSRTGLHLAVSKKFARLVELLLGVDANKDFKDRWGKSPEEYAQDDGN